MVRNAIHNAFLNTLTMGTPFPRVPPQVPQTRRLYASGESGNIVVTVMTFCGNDILRKKTGLQIRVWPKNYGHSVEQMSLLYSLLVSEQKKNSIQNAK